MSFVENCYTQFAIILSHRKLFFCSGMIHYQMKAMKSFSGQFINIYNKPNDFHQMIWIFFILTWKRHITVINNCTFCCSTTLIQIVTIIFTYRCADFFFFFFLLLSFLCSFFFSLSFILSCFHYYLTEQ